MTNEFVVFFNDSLKIKIHPHTCNPESNSSKAQSIAASVMGKPGIDLFSWKKKILKNDLKKNFEGIWAGNLWPTAKLMTQLS